MKRKIVLFSLIFFLVGLLIGYVLFNLNRIPDETSSYSKLADVILTENSILGKPVIQFSFDRNDCKNRFLETHSSVSGNNVICNIDLVYTDVLGSHLDDGTVETRAICSCEYS